MKLRELLEDTGGKMSSARTAGFAMLIAGIVCAFTLKDEVLTGIFLVNAMISLGLRKQ